MGTFAAGQTVIVHFPFSDLTASKLRPAIVLAEAGRGDWILCPNHQQILRRSACHSTGCRRLDRLTMRAPPRGSLHLTSYARPGKLLTAHASLVAGSAGDLVAAK